MLSVVMLNVIIVCHGAFVSALHGTDTLAYFRIGANSPQKSLSRLGPDPSSRILLP
jgi:hypothetical protein